MNRSAIRTLELQALEAVRQAAEPGTSAAAEKACFETAKSAMRSVAELKKSRAKPATKRKRAKRAPGTAPSPRRKHIVLFG